MSKYNIGSEAMTLSRIQGKKDNGERLTMLTCYDAAFARLLDETGIDMVLVGDSLGNVMLGFENTISVTMEHMLHHSAAVSRVLTRPFVVMDMPFFSYNVGVEQAMANGARALQEGGAQAIKMEGGHHILPQVRALVKAGIPVMGHIGLTPQSVHSLSGYKLQGRGSRGAKIIEEAKALEEAGAFAIVLELIPQTLARELSESLRIPTIGIGAGSHCSGQVLVLHDMLGFDAAFRPKFLKQYAQVGTETINAVKAYVKDVQEGVFPGAENSFSG